MSLTATIGKLSFSTLLLALLLVSLLILGTSSSGTLRGGDEDTGSGFGGTGRNLLPGSESGLGGTGFRPILGLNETGELKILSGSSPDVENIEAAINTAVTMIEKHPPLDLAVAVTAPVAVVNSDYLEARDSSEVSITSIIQRELNINAISMNALRSAAASNPASEQQAAEQVTDRQPSWQQLARYLLDEEHLPATENTLHTDAGETRRVQRPDRLQRPELPPLQRVRPIQRAAVLPPRIKPLAL